MVAALKKVYKEKVIAFIPAKANSTEIHEKNLKLVNGKSLVFRSFEFATNHPAINQVILSTDSYKIVNNCVPGAISQSIFSSIAPGHVKQLSDKIYVHRRDTKHATSTARTIECVLNFLKHAQKDLQESRYLLLLQPTSPFRNKEELLDIIKMSEKMNCLSIISAKLFDSPHPEKAFRIDANFNLENLKVLQNRLSIPRQALEKFYVFDGAYYFTDIELLLKYKSFVSIHTRIFIREGWKTLNIDNNEDLNLANYIASKERL